jgi:hypothetical protein
MEYAVIGGLASSAWGEPRVTADVDLVATTDVAGGLQLVQSLGESAFVPLFPGVEEVVARSFILPLRHRQTGIKVDIAIGMSGFERQVTKRAKLIMVGDREIAFATAEDVLIMKVLAGRPRDLEDARGIAGTRRDQLDWNYCLEVAQQLSEAIGQDLTTQIRSLQ